MDNKYTHPCYHMTHLISTINVLFGDFQIYIIVYTVIALGLVALPVLLYDSAGMTIKYASGSLILFIILTTTVTLLFIPKVSDA